MKPECKRCHGAQRLRRCRVATDAVKWPLGVSIPGIVGLTNSHKVPGPPTLVSRVLRTVRSLCRYTLVDCSKVSFISGGTKWLYRQRSFTGAEPDRRYETSALKGSTRL